MKKVAILSNSDAGLYHFRKELVQELLNEGNEVYLLLPNGEKVDILEKMGCVFYDVPIERRGTNPIKDLRLLFKYINLLKKIKPDVILTYTIKPNVYGGMAARVMRIPYIANITGLGTSIENPGLLQKLSIFLYRCGLKSAKCVFCQNQENVEFIQKRKIAKDRIILLPGSGVNLQHFTSLEYPNTETIKFAFISRIMRDKGAGEYLQAARMIKSKYPQTEFHVCGYCEEDYEKMIDDLQKNEAVIYHGVVQDVKKILKDVHCVVLPSYHEGMSNVLLEASATGRPCIATDIAGCREIVRDSVTGFLVVPRSVDDLYEKMERFIQLSFEEKREMGLEARSWVERHFDRQQVIDAYMIEIRGETDGGNL